MASTLVDQEPASYRNEGFCAALELAVAAADEFGPQPVGRDAGLDERARREAILRLRTGATLNPALLPLLADGRFAETVGQQTGSDDVNRALGVPDLFCFEAPPGPVQTRTVLDIVCAAVGRGERVLLVAPTSPRVDDVPALLPDGAMVLRADQPGSGPGSPAAEAARVQQRILARSQDTSRSLEPWLGEPSPALGRLRRLITALGEAAEARGRADRAAAHREAAVAHVEQDVDVRAAADRAAFAELSARRALESAERAARHLARLLDGVADVPGWTADPAGLSDLADHCLRLEPVLRGRAGLLREWRHRAARPSAQLHTELLRYADVVAASCLGAGRPEYGDLEFDLMILQDASRVPLPTALVPMVRARRVVLVGQTGHPPLRDREVVRAWLAARCPAGTDARELSALLTGSVFERMSARAPARNRAVSR